MNILVTPRSFGKNNPELFDRLRDHGLSVIRNDTGAILSEEAMIERIADCQGVILGIDPMNARVLAQAKKLKAIAKYGVGTDNIDLEECKKRNIAVSRTVGANSNAVADYAFALMLAVARRVLVIDRRCRNADWGKMTGIDIYGKTLGIVGLGAVGKAVALRAQGFSMKILAYDVFHNDEWAGAHGVTYTDLDTLIQEADIISLHAALTDTNHHLLSQERIARMKQTAIVINTARGELVDEDALLAALMEKRIYGAGLDVFAHEPPDNPAWFSLDSVVLGSHTSSSTIGATEAMGTLAVDNLLRDLGIST
ncbi:MAG: phosphoglycerate dehydrogenase [Desulfovibrionaceae bacterium]|nr:phosphoglycerate dehydrogenase [Desulfovibrionaceae bacterium]